MPYWELYYHLVWSTWERQPMLSAEIEPVVHNYLRTKAIGLGALVYAVNGTADHVHMVAAVPPKVSVATFIGQVKGASSTKFNQTSLAKSRFKWQDEYGAFSFDRKRLPYVVSYVERQKEHHATKTAISILERIQAPPTTTVREPSSVYLVDYDDWARELRERTVD